MQERGADGQADSGLRTAGELPAVMPDGEQAAQAGLFRPAPAEAEERREERMNAEAGSEAGRFGEREEEAERQAPASAPPAQERTAERPEGKPRGQEESAGKREQPMEHEEQAALPDTMEGFRELLKRGMGFGTSFDIVLREMTFGGRRTALVFLNGLGKDTVLTEILKRLTYLEPSSMSADALHDFFDLYIPAVQVVKEQTSDKMFDGILSGSSAFYIEGERNVLMIDAKNFPARGPEEPSLERVVRGARDGFVETLMMNISLVRRRLRDTELRYEIMRVGRRTKTDVCVAYIDDIVDKTIVKSVVESIKPLDIAGLPLADTQLDEAMVKKSWNPYPLSRYSERPDVVAAHLLDGNVAIFVDTSPSVMIVPTTLFDLMQHAEENRQTPLIGTYLRWVRFIGIFASVFLLPLWFLFAVQPELLPPALSFIGPTTAGRLPILLQFLMAEIGIDLMRLAAIHTPTPLAMAISLVSAILIGDIAVKTGLFVNEVILYMAVAAIGMFATPNYELSLANRITRLLLLVTAAMFSVPGFMLMSTVIILYLASQRSHTRPYLWPFIPFDPRALFSVLVRRPFLSNERRPNLLKTADSDTMAGNGAAKNANDE